MRALMSDVKNYIEYAMRAMETTREQSESLLADTKQHPAADRRGASATELRFCPDRRADKNLGRSINPHGCGLQRNRAGFGRIHRTVRSA